MAKVTGVTGPVSTGSSTTIIDSSATAEMEIPQTTEENTQELSPGMHARAMLMYEIIAIIEDYTINYG